jgi:diacylglycerol O-acyltransferase 2, plant
MIPFVRQLWYGLGLRPADKREIERIMNVGGSILLCPGGVQECVLMQHDKERLYLKKRQGFVRMAIKHGASLVPVFAVGQRDHYSWYRLPLPAYISRKLGAAPIVMWGVLGSPIPHEARMTIIVGRPIGTRIDGEILKNPSDDQVQALLDKFIEAIKGIYERHGPADVKLEVL